VGSFTRVELTSKLISVTFALASVERINLCTLAPNFMQRGGWIVNLVVK